MVVTHTIVASTPKHDPGRDLQKKNTNHLTAEVFV